jgi:chemotaxis protein MotB
VAKKQKQQPAGAPKWLVTFADLMSLLVCFFVLIISFSIQDKEKLQVVAGSMRDAFGIKFVTKKAGMIEFEGSPVREFVKKVAAVDSENNSEFAQEEHDQNFKQGPEANTHNIEETNVERPRQFALAAASLRQAWQEMPVIHELSDNIMVEETPTGLHIQLIDQEGRSMFPKGSKYPYERTREILAKMAPVISRLPNRITITGHTDNIKQYNSPDYTLWDLSADRAKVTRQILSEYGIPDDRFHSISGRAYTDPLFPEAPSLAANRRISILLMSEAPAYPPEFRP